MGNKPNVLLLTIDTLRADILGCYGYRKPISPNIDRLAEGGIRFQQAITGGSWTQAAFPVLLTSTYASMYGGCLGPLAGQRPSPISALSAQGYTTGAFSTSPLLSRTYAYDRGFHHFVDLVPGETDPFLRRIKGGQFLLRKPLTHQLAAVFNKQIRPASLYVSATELTNEVCRWLDEVDGPFFAWVHYMDVHWPYHCESQLKKPQEVAQAWHDLDHMHKANWEGVPITAAQRQHYINLYEQALQYTDAEIGRLLDYMDSLDLSGDTVVILVSDHGEEFMERRYWGHFENNLHDEILKVPLIITLPRRATGQVIERQVRLLDIMPTVLDLCSCVPPEGLQGTSMRPLWSGEAGLYDPEVSISEMQRGGQHMIAVRTEGFKYIWDNQRPDQPRLFNLQTDPHERHNVFEDFPQEAAQLQAHVDEHRQRVDESNINAHDGVEPDLDEAIIRRLRDLGYVQ
ncbi:MAG: sulfatase [Anaerolineaceae bacterium]|nr:sulfatase [Anaerolineaceae bacterium]